jgi:hypothetical protein
LVLLGAQLMRQENSEGDGNRTAEQDAADGRRKSSTANKFVVRAAVNLIEDYMATVTVREFYNITNI